MMLNKIDIKNKKQKQEQKNKKHNADKRDKICHLSTSWRFIKVT